MTIGKKVVFLIFLCFSFSFLLFSEQDENQETPSLSHIDELVEKTDYNAALNELSRYMSQKSDDFDAGQKRVDEVLEKRRKYNELAQELLRVLETGEDGEEKSLRVLEIVSQLKALEKNPTDKSNAFIRQAEVAAQGTVYRARYFAIMEEGSALVKDGQYLAAEKRFRDGFSLYRAEFDAEQYPADFKNPVYGALSDIEKKCALVPAAMQRCQDAYDSLVRAITERKTAIAKKEFVSVQESFASYAALRNQIASSGEVFRTQFARLKESDPYLPDQSFLGFAWRFSLGRASDPDSGVVGALDAFWNTRVETLKSLLYDQVRSDLQEAVSLGSRQFFLPKKNYSAQLSHIPYAEDFSEIGLSVQHLYALLKKPDGSTAEDSFREYAASMEFARTLSSAISSSYGAMDAISSAKPLRSRDKKTVPQKDDVFASMVGTLGENARAHEKIYEAAVLSDEIVQKELERERASSGRKKPDARNAAGVEISDATLDFSSACKPFSSMNQKIAEEAKTASSLLWTLLATRCAERADSELDEYTKRHAQIVLLCDGNESDAFPKKNPSQAVSQSQTFSADVTKSRGTIAGWKTLLLEGEPYRESQPDFARGADEVGRVISALDKLLSENAALVSRAQKQVQDAKKAENEAEGLYGQAAAALKRANFEGARKLLENARGKYNESLSLQDDEALRRRSDDLLAKLGADIVMQENEIVVREVRELKKQARNAYYAGNFEEADNRLVQAKNRWAATNVEEDKEITDLQALVTTALSMITGRIIPPADPLYPEMSQMLSRANQYYAEGKTLMKEGSQSEAKKKLLQAKKELRNVLIPYPFNQSASLLNLRIDQLIDEKGFRESFRQKIDSAKNDYKEPKKRQRAYTDLLDLYEIDPSYPGLKKLIADIELELGLRQKPVDKSHLEKSKKLAEQAQKMYKNAGRDEIKLRSALAQVDEAIALNPDNDDAILLKDRIQIAIGGKAVIALSAADEALYQQAIQKLQRGDDVGALATVEQLLKKQGNLRSSKLRDLQRRLRERLEER